MGVNMSKAEFLPRATSPLVSWGPESVGSSRPPPVLPVLREGRSPDTVITKPVGGIVRRARGTGSS